jgi:hypothetical protein
VSKTYMEAERRWLARYCDLRVISVFRKPNLSMPNPAHYEQIGDGDWSRLLQILEEFKPQQIHGHYLHCLPLLVQLARTMGVGCTVRCHSYDILNPAKMGGQRIQQVAAVASHDEHCQGILAFPFARTLLEGMGVLPNKIVDCNPAIDFGRFYDPSPNQAGVMNMGVVLPKKAMGDFLRLAGLVPEKQFRLYTMGFDSDALRRENDSLGNPVEMIDLVAPDDMAAQYKRHDWLVYTASGSENAVGWPMAIAEAQASGLGVCMRNLRPDLREYVGPLARLYDDVSELKEIVRAPPSVEEREAGFEMARLSDIALHGHLLTDLWPVELRPQTGFSGIR